MGSIDGALSDETALRGRFLFTVDVDATGNIFGGAQRAQNLGAHVAELAVGSNKVGAPRRGRRAHLLGSVLRDVRHHQGVLHPWKAFARGLSLRWPL